MYTFLDHYEHLDLHFYFFSRVETEQMEAIYKLMQKHSAQFGDTTMDDMKNQMQLYGFSWKASKALSGIS